MTGSCSCFHQFAVDGTVELEAGVLSFPTDAHDRVVMCIRGKAQYTFQSSLKVNPVIALKHILSTTYHTICIVMLLAWVDDLGSWLPEYILHLIFLVIFFIL